MDLKRYLIFGSALVLAATAMADLKSDTQRQFDKYSAAVKAKDGVTIEKVLRSTFAQDFKFMPKHGKSVDLSKWIEDEKMMISMTDKVKSVSVHIDSMNAGKGVATMKITLRYAGVAKIDPKGKPGLLNYVATSDQTMVRKGGKWWVTQMKEVSSKSTFNGKPLGM